MIISSLNNRTKYYSMNTLFEKAFNFALDNIYTLAEGEYCVEEDNIYLIITEGELRSEFEAPLEAHNIYIDIQIVIRGIECFGVRDRSRCNFSKEKYDKECDIEFYDDKFENRVTLVENDFIIFFPEDAHAPLIGEGCVRKAIIKIRN